MKTVSLTLALLLSGCVTVPVRPALQETQPGKIYVSAEDQQPCEKLVSPPEGPMSEEATGELMVRWLNTHESCSSSKMRLLRAIQMLNEKS